MMRLTKKKLWMIRGSVVIAAAAGALFASCTAKGPPRPTCEDVNDAGADVFNMDAYTTVTTDARPTEDYGMESDPGPQCTDCLQQRGYEVMTVADFEDGYAPAWFNYGEPGIPIEPPQAGEAIDDEGMTIVGRNPPQPWWGLQVATLASRPGGKRCGSQYALHMEGGPFTSWGGGYVTRHFIVRGEYMTRTTPTGQKYCVNNRQPPRDELLNGIGQPPAFMPEQTTVAELATGCMFWASPVASQPSLLGVDVSDFDGVSFWARRGPSGQSQLRIGLIDSNVSEELALFHERRHYLSEVDAGNPMPDPDQAGAACTRIKSCCRGCDEIEYNRFVPAQTVDAGDGGDGGMIPAHCEITTEKRCHTDGERVPQCRETEDGGIQMFDHRISGCGQFPEAGAPVDAGDPCWRTPPDQVANQWDDDFPLCCPPTMENETPSEFNGDPRYGGTECSPYVFLFDYSSGSYCHNEGDVLPERNQNRCGEGFEANVVVDTEWKFFRIPWSELRRFTPDKPPIDPKRIWQIAFYFGAGYLDTYVDDVGFYRKRR